MLRAKMQHHEARTRRIMEDAVALTYMGPMLRCGCLAHPDPRTLITEIFDYQDEDAIDAAIAYNNESADVAGTKAIRHTSLRDSGSFAHLASPCCFVSAPGLH